MRLRVIVGALGAFLLVPVGAAWAQPIEVGPCSDPDAIVVRVGQTAKVCVNPPDHNIKIDP